MVKIEAFDHFHFMHQAVRVCCTDHTDSIIARIASSFLLKYASESHQKLHSVLMLAILEKCTENGQIQSAISDEIQEAYLRRNELAIIAIMLSL